MTRQLRMDMRQYTRRLRGLLTLLTDDIYHVKMDASSVDLASLGESIADVKSTLQMFSDTTADLEYTIHLLNRETLQ